MPRYRKRPLVIEAEQWFVGKPVRGVTPATRAEGAYVVTIHGRKAYLDDGDWVIAEPDGVHFYPCKPAVFAAMCDLVPEPVLAVPRVDDHVRYVLDDGDGVLDATVTRVGEDGRIDLKYAGGRDTSCFVVDVPPFARSDADRNESYYLRDGEPDGSGEAAAR